MVDSVGVGTSALVSQSKLSFNASSGILYATTLSTTAIKDKDGDLGTSNQVLTSTGSQINWQDLGAISGSGTLLSVNRATTDVPVTHTSAYASTGLTITFTPTSVNSTIIILVNQPCRCDNDGAGGIRIMRNDATSGITTLYDPGITVFSVRGNGSQVNCAQVANLQYIDKPAKTIPVTYYTEGTNRNGNFQTNRGDNGGTGTVATSQIYAIEFS